MRAVAKTDVGLVRTINEDAYYVPEAGECFAAVADGMGGHRAGEVASAMAIQAFSDWLRDAPMPEETRLRDAFRRANQTIYWAAIQDVKKKGMGTTLSAIWFGRQEAYIGHVGDSRVYRLRDGALTQITTDHTLVGEMVRDGAITPEMALTHPQRNVITRALGSRGVIDVDVMRVDLRSDDLWLLCSDGLTKYASDEALTEMLTAQASMAEKAQQLIDYALMRGGADNVTALLATGRGEANA